VAAGSPLIKTDGTAAPIYSIYDNNSAKNKRKNPGGKNANGGRENAAMCNNQGSGPKTKFPQLQAAETAAEIAAAANSNSKFSQNKKKIQQVT